MTRVNKFPKIKSHLKILGARRVTRKKFPTEGPQTFGSTIDNLVAWSTKRLGCVHPCCITHHATFSRWALRPCLTPKPEGHSVSAIKGQLLTL